MSAETDAARTTGSDFDELLKEFLAASAYARQGGVITDLDGTVVHEEAGRVYLPEPVTMGLKALYDAGRPLVINTLRFPLSVLRTFGAEWLALAGAPVPAVTLNGSQLGFVTRAGDAMVFEEIVSFPLLDEEIGEVLAGVRGLLEAGIRNLLVFRYPRDWQQGECVWTPDPGRVDHVREKYPSATEVICCEYGQLEDMLTREPHCMIFMLVDVPEDQRMAYQHTRRRHFLTHEGVDKLHGAREMASRLNIDLPHSIGAGDTEMDTFLNGVGLAVIVGARDLHFRGSLHTLRLQDAFALGQLLFRLADLQRELRA